MANTHRVIRIDTHRPVILGRDTCNGSCETATGCLCAAQNERQGRGPVPKQTGPRNKPSKASRFVFRLVLALLAGALVWHLLARVLARVVAQVGGGL